MFRLPVKPAMTVREIADQDGNDVVRCPVGAGHNVLFLQRGKVLFVKMIVLLHK